MNNIKVGINKNYLEISSFEILMFSTPLINILSKLDICILLANISRMVPTKAF